MWLYQGKQFTLEDVHNFYGFVYSIKNNLTGRTYIGRKYFSKAGFKTVKGKKRRIRKTSDWENYWSSSEEVKQEVSQYGKESFTRTILHLCTTRASCSYMETYEILKLGALLSEEYYNSWVSCKIHKAHVKGIICQKNQVPTIVLKKQTQEEMDT